MQHRVYLNRPQRRAFAALNRRQTVAINWGRGVGKSWFIRAICYLLVSMWDGHKRPGLAHSGIRIVLLMPFLNQCKKVHQELTEAELDGDWKFLGGTLNKSEYIIRFPGGSWIKWIGADAAKGNRGLRCDVIVSDETDDIEPSTYDAIAKPWLSEPFSLQMALAGGTPTRGRYGLLYKLFRLGKDGHKGHHAIHATFRDVPEHVDPEYVEGVRATTEPSLFAREWEGDFDAAEGLVYSPFSEDFHVRRPEPGTRWSEILVGVDHGYEDPGVFLVIGVAGSGKDAVCHVLQEVVHQHETEAFWVNEARKLLAEYRGQRMRWYPDPSQPARIKALRQAGCLIGEVDNTIEDGVQAVADRLVIREDKEGNKTTRLLVDPSCKFTVGEFGKYRRKRDSKDKDRVTDQIEDRNNHAMDALRYAVFGRFGGVLRKRTVHDDSSFTFG